MKTMKFTDFGPFKLTKRSQIKQLQEMVSGQYKQIQGMYRTQESMTLTLGTLSRNNSAYVGNSYRTYETAVKAIEDKYNAQAEWGVTLTGNIIDLRAVFIIQNGIQIRKAEGLEGDDGDKEVDWVEAFLAHNKLDREMIHEIAKEAEIEGKIALYLTLDEKADPAMVSIQFISWSDKKYVVHTKENDYLTYTMLTWTPDAGSSKKQELKVEEFVYNKFGGRLSKPNQAQPKIMKCLTQIDDVDRALRDWREINELFAAPVPDVKCDDKETAEQAAVAWDKFNMKIRKAFIHAKSVFSFVGPPIEGMDSLLKEIETKIKIIAGNTSIPIHYLGLLDLLKNRATGDSTREVVIAGTTKERDIWKGTIQEVIEKAMAKFNASTGVVKMSGAKKLDPKKIIVDIPVFTQEQWDHIEKVLLPMYLADGISLEYILSQIPNLNVSKEMERLAQKKEDRVDVLEAENQAMKDEQRLAQLTGGNQQVDQEPS
jgi:hypothetical protein